MDRSYTYHQLKKIVLEDTERIKNFRKIPDDLMCLKPDPSSWNAGEIFQHLVKFNNIYLLFIGRALEQKKTVEMSAPEFKARLPVHWMIQFMKPPYKIKIGTIAPMYPVDSSNDDYRRSLEDLIHTNHQILEKIEFMREKKLDLNRIKEKNTVFKFSMTLIEYILMFDAHQKRHIWQTEQTLYKLSGEKY